MTRLIAIASLAVLALLLLRRRRDDRIPASWREASRAYLREYGDDDLRYYRERWDDVQPWDPWPISLIDPKQRGAL